MKQQNDGSEKFFIIAKAAFYFAIVASIVIFTINYGLTNWENVATDIGDAIEEASKMVDCKIDYKDFHYEGLCADREEIFNFLINESQGGRI